MYTFSTSPSIASLDSIIFHFLSIRVSEVVIPDAKVTVLVFEPENALLLQPQTKKSPSF